MDSKTSFLIRIKKTWKALYRQGQSFFVGKNKIANTAQQVILQKELDKKLIYSLSKSRFPTWGQLKYLKKYLSPKEKKLISISFILLLISLFFVGKNFYSNHLKTVPITGGVYTEALLGVPQTINPLYANRSDVDSDLTALIFSSLFKRGSNGELQKDLVDDFFVSNDSKTYEFTIKKNVKWHDNSDLTVNDIVFTFNAIQDPLYKSPLQASFIGVSIKQIDDYSFRFILTEPYAAFLDLLTFGILPADIWSQIQPESASLATLNLKPIGSGAYKFASLSRDNAGSIKEYKLAVNQNYYNQHPYIDLAFKFFTSFDNMIKALNDNNVDGISYLPFGMEKMLVTPKSLQIHKIFFPQITLIFLNQKTNLALADKAVRQSLALAIDRRAIVNDVLKGDAYIVDSPILANSFAYNDSVKKYIYNQTEAEKLLDSVDWKLVTINQEQLDKAQKDLQAKDEDIKNKAQDILSLGLGSWRQKNGKYLTINLSTVNRQENSQIVEAVKKYWENIGIKVTVQVIPAKRIQGEVIRPRNFEALFYAQVLGADPDPYAFWHSSQAEKGFNIADYSNKKVDKLLEEARLNPETIFRQKKYQVFQELIAEDEPVIFMYSPHYTYVQTNKIKGFNIQDIITPSDRFANVVDWYMKTGKKLYWN